MNHPTKRLPDSAPYPKRLGERLRHVRASSGLSLADVEFKSNGVWKAVVIGSYERGDRAITVTRLAALAAFYGVNTTDLLPDTATRPQSPAEAVSWHLREALAELEGAKDGEVELHISLRRVELDSAAPHEVVL